MSHNGASPRCPPHLAPLHDCSEHTKTIHPSEEPRLAHGVWSCSKTNIGPKSRDSTLHFVINRPPSAGLSTLPIPCSIAWGGDRVDGSGPGQPTWLALTQPCLADAHSLVPCLVAVDWMQAVWSAVAVVTRIGDSLAVRRSFCSASTNSLP